MLRKLALHSYCSHSANSDFKNVVLFKNLTSLSINSECGGIGFIEFDSLEKLNKLVIEGIDASVCKKISSSSKKLFGRIKTLVLKSWEEWSREVEEFILSFKNLEKLYLKRFRLLDKERFDWVMSDGKFKIFISVFNREYCNINDFSFEKHEVDELEFGCEVHNHHRLSRIVFPCENLMMEGL